MHFGGTHRSRSILAGMILVAMLIIIAQYAAHGQPSNNLYVANPNSSVISQFVPNPGGNVAPAATLSGSSTNLQAPFAIAIDASGNAYVANLAAGPGGTGSITTYAAGTSGNIAPLTAISGIATMLAEPAGITVDRNGNIYVANLSNIVTEYSPGSNGNAAPIATIAGPDTMLAAPDAIALDARSKIYVANLIGGSSAAGSITIYASGSSGDAAPITTITGPSTDLSAPEALALDSAGNIYVANLTGGSLNLGAITVYPSGSNGDSTPDIVIAGPDTGLLNPQGIAVDSSGNIYVSNTSNSILEFAHGASGDATPMATVSGANTGLDGPRGLALQPQLTTSATPTPTPSVSITATTTATATATATSTKTATATPTKTATATASATLTVTATATPTATRTATPTTTATMTTMPTNTGRTPTATATVVCPPLAPAADFDLTGLASKPVKLPALKPIKFTAQIPLGTTSTNAPNDPFTLKLPASVTITGITVSDPNFLATTTCTGQSTQCSVSISFHPLKAGAHHGTLTIANNIKPIMVTLSGSGAGPKVRSVSPRSAKPLTSLTLSGSGFQPLGSVLVGFSEKPKNSKPVMFLVPGLINSAGNSVGVQVPPIFDPNTLDPIDGTATLSLDELLFPTGTAISSKSPPLKITPYDVMNGLPPGSATMVLLQNIQMSAMNLQTEVVVGTPLSGLANNLRAEATAAMNLLNAISINPNQSIGSVNGVQIMENTQTLQGADAYILSMLQMMAGNSSGGGAPVHANLGSGCLAAEAAQALADDGNPAAFANDITQLFANAQSSPACKEPGAAIATLGIVNGSAGVALAITSEAGNSTVQPVLPITALLLAELGPTGEVLGLSAALGQTTPQAQQAVEASVASFNRAAQGQLKMLVGETQGPLNTTYSNINQNEQSFDATTPQPLDGTYAGSFTGTQFVTGACPSTIMGSLSYAVQGGNITVTLPGGGSGTLDTTTGAATFAPGSGIGGANVSCSFGGTFLPNPSASATASGTWSCVSTGAGSTFNSANGTWTATQTAP